MVSSTDGAPTANSLASKARGAMKCGATSPTKVGLPCWSNDASRCGKGPSGTTTTHRPVLLTTLRGCDGRRTKAQAQHRAVRLNNDVSLPAQRRVRPKSLVSISECPHGQCELQREAAPQVLPESEQVALPQPQDAADVFPCRAAKAPVLVSLDIMSHAHVEHDGTSPSPSPTSHLTEAALLKSQQLLAELSALDLDLKFGYPCDTGDEQSTAYNCPSFLEEDDSSETTCDVEFDADKMAHDAASTVDMFEEIWGLIRDKKARLADSPGGDVNTYDFCDAGDDEGVSTECPTPSEPSSSFASTLASPLETSRSPRWPSIAIDDVPNGIAGGQASLVDKLRDVLRVGLPSARSGGHGEILSRLRQVLDEADMQSLEAPVEDFSDADVGFLRTLTEMLATHDQTRKASQPVMLAIRPQQATPLVVYSAAVPASPFSTHRVFSTPFMMPISTPTCSRNPIIGSMMAARPRVLSPPRPTVSVFAPISRSLIPHRGSGILTVTQSVTTVSVTNHFVM